MVDEAEMYDVDFVRKGFLSDEPEPHTSSSSGGFFPQEASYGTGGLVSADMQVLGCFPLCDGCAAWMLRATQSAFPGVLSILSSVARSAIHCEQRGILFQLGACVACAAVN